MRMRPHQAVAVDDNAVAILVLGKKAEEFATSVVGA
jgi:hypothetical protein